MANCVECGTKDVVFTCPTCGQSYCGKHAGSTDIYYCKKHASYELNYNEYQKRRYRCQILSNSQCPKCHHLLEQARLDSGQYYLKCTHCSWNSRLQSPVIQAFNERSIEKEAARYGLTNHGEICHEKLKRKKGKFYCIDCLLNLLNKQITTPYSKIRSQFRFSNLEIERILKDLLNEKKIEGFFDTKQEFFVSYTSQLDAQLVAQLQANSFLDLDKLSEQLGVTPNIIDKIIIEMIRRNKLRGTFNQPHTKYYLEAGMYRFILDELRAQGRIQHAKLAAKYQVPEGIIKKYITNMMRNKMFQGYFADGGRETVTQDELEAEIELALQKNGLFLITALANQLRISPELTRRTLFNLVQKGVIRGIFTQNHEFITEETLTEKIKEIARAYRTIPIKELARKLAITERRVEEGLATLISRGSVAGYIDMKKHVFVADAVQPITQLKFHRDKKQIPTQNSRNSQNNTQGTTSNTNAPIIRGEVEVVRQYDFVGGQLHFKVVVRNKTNMAIHDIKVILDVPSSYRRARDLLTIPVIDPGNTHGVDFYLEPAECGISTIGGTVLYKDALGNMHSIHIKGKEVQIKCPLVIKTLDTIEDCQKAIQSLPSDARAFLVADLPPQMAFSAAYRAISQFDTRNVASIEDDSEGYYEGEAWFSSEAKVTGGRIITRIYMNGKTSTLEIRVWCNEAGQLTGFLAKIIELLFVEINLMRKIKAEERGRTLDAMAITRNIMETIDMCMLRYKASSVRLKLNEIYTRINRISNKFGDDAQLIYDWTKKLEEKYVDEEALLEDEDADKLEKDLETIHQHLNTQLAL